jgi:hypothetical protein
VNVTVADPAGTVTVPGTVSMEGGVELRLTTNPPPGAGFVSETVHVPDAPGLTDCGHVRPLSAAGAGGGGAGATETADDLLAPPKVAVTVADCVEVTVPAVAEKVDEVNPDPTVTEAGTPSALLFDESAITLPPEGAAADRLTVQVLAPPDVKDVGHCKDASDGAGGGGGVTVSAAVREAPEYDAEIVTAVEAATV